MKNLLIGIKLFLAMTILLGVIYPFVMTGISQIAFPQKANGSMIKNHGKYVGSELIGQQFQDQKYFWGRPSAIGNNPLPSGGSNLSPVGEPLREIFNARVDTIRKYHGNLAVDKIPKDLLFASGSGVDPHISPETAYFQVERIAKARNFNDNQKNQLIKLINSSIESPDFYIFGTYRINVLELNLKIDEL